MAIVIVEGISNTSSMCWPHAWVVLVKFVRHDISWMFWINSVYKTSGRKILYPSVLTCY